MAVLVYILFGLLTIYAFFLFYLALGFLRTGTFRVKEKFLQLPITLIICARNEEQTITQCLQSIVRQNYVMGKIQLIVINDNSSDLTAQLAEAVLKESDINYKIISNQQQKGKKESISYAMQFANNHLIVLRDADTFTVSNKWLQSISDFYQTHQSDLIIAPIAIANNFGMLWALQAIETIVLSSATCGSAFYRKPFLCNGANLIFTKSIFERANGYSSHINQASGDDVLFLEDVKKIPNAKIHYLKSRDAIVYTYPCYSFSQLIQQKVRWASKFKFNPNKINFFLAGLSFVINAAWVFSFAYCYFNLMGKEPFLLYILVKLLIDILLLFLALSFIRNKNIVWFTLPVGCIYPIYACVVACCSIIIKPRWKV